MNKGFDKDELAAWFKQEDFFPAVKDKSDVKYWTNSWPYPLQFALISYYFDDSYTRAELSASGARDNGGISGDATALDRVVSLYTETRNIENNTLQIHFEDQFCKTQANLEAHINAIVWMELGVERCRGQSYILNQQFMFSDNVIKSITPLVQQFLVDR